MRKILILFLWMVSVLFIFMTPVHATPKYFDNSTNSTVAGEPVEFRLRWTDNVGLSGYVFSFDNGTNTFTNDSWVSWKWLDSWLHRKNITINNSQNSNALTSYPVFINVTYDDDMQPDFDDLRFTYFNNTDNSEVELNYWIENNVSSNHAEVWVNVTYIPANDYSTVYMYYGNSTVSTTSNVSKVLYYEDFESTPNGQMPAGWTKKTGSDICEVQDGVFYAQDIGGGASDYSSCAYSISLPKYRKIDFDFKYDYDGGGSGVIWFFLNNTFNSWGSFNCLVGATNACRLHNSTTYQYITTRPDKVWYHGQANITSIGSNRINITWKWWNSTETFNSSILDDEPSSDKLLFGILSNLNNDYKLTIDNVTIRQFSEPEPTYSIGLEEPKKCTSITECWSNVTKVVNSTLGVTIRWRVYANDTSNQWNTSDVYSFPTIDIPPTYSFNSTNSTVAGEPVEFRLRWTDNLGLSKGILSIDNCTGIFQNQSWKSLSGKEDWLNDTYIVNSTIGCTIRWKQYVNDTENNWNESEIFSFVTIDGTPPIWFNNVTSPNLPVTYSPGRSYQFNVTWQDLDTDVSVVQIEHNFTGVLTNYTLVMNESSKWYYDYSDLGAGTYVWREYANNTDGYENKTDQWIYKVQQNTTTPYIYLYLNGSRANFEMITTKYLNTTAVLQALSSGYVEIWTNYSDGQWKVWNSGNSPLENVTQIIWPGIWNFTANFTSVNYTSPSYESWYVNVTGLTSPNVTLWKQNATIAYAFGFDDNKILNNTIDWEFLKQINGSRVRETMFLNTWYNYSKSRHGTVILFTDALFRGHDIEAHGYTHYDSPPANPQEWLQNTTREFQNAFGYIPPVLSYPNCLHASDTYTNDYFIYGRDCGPTSTGAIDTLPTPDGEAGLYSSGVLDSHCTSGDFYNSFYDIYYNYGGSDNAAYYFSHHTSIGLENKTCYKEEIDRINDESDVWYATWGEIMAYRLEHDNVTITDHEYDQLNKIISFKVNLTGAQERWPNKTVNIPLTYRVDIPDDWDSPVFLDDGKISSAMNTTIESGYVYVDGIPDGRTLKIYKNAPFIDNTPPVIENLTVEYIDSDTTMAGQFIYPRTDLFIRFDVDDTQSKIEDVNITIYSPTGNANFRKTGPGDDTLYDYKRWLWNYEWFGNETYLFFEEVENPIFWNNNTYGRFVINVSNSNVISDTYIYIIEVSDISGNRIIYSNKLDGSSCTANTECRGGYCVHNICRSASTYCGDGYCDSGESCFSCLLDCGICKGGFPSEEEEELPEEIPEECPICPEPTDWSECINNQQTRTNYRCSAETNYQCQSYTEERDCISKEEIKPTWIDVFYKYWYIPSIVVIIILFLFILRSIR